MWYEVTEDKLLNQAKYTLQQFQNRIIAENFYDALKNEVDKLPFTTNVYQFQKKKEISALNGKY